MKKICFLLAFLTGMLSACTNTKEDDKDDTNNDQGGNTKNMSKRDVSINSQNAYSDLFLDSTTMEGFITQHHVADSVSRRMRSFYNTRNYQYAWFSTDGLTEQAREFWNVHDYYTTYEKDTSLTDKALAKRMNSLIAEEGLSVGASDKSYQNTELTLTQHFIEYTLKNFQGGYVKRKEMERFVPFKKQDVLTLADSIINKKHKDNKYFEQVNESYGNLKDELKRYYQIAKQGGWQAITGDKKSLKKGVTSPAIVAIKRRLQLTGEMPGKDTTQVFNDTLEAAVKAAQVKFGYKPDGVITSTLIKDLNVPVINRLRQIIINMDRMRWMPKEPKGNLILVNIPEFVLHVTDGKNKIFDMNVVVGKEGHNTVMFTGDLNQVVFSPYWNVPPSIVKKEILPKMESNPGYLESQNMEITGNEEGLPAIRQRPGATNSLGKVKFLFPNSFNIYFHDTNAKSLFSQDKRAYSHGCIRLAEPEKMADFLLQNDPNWPPEKIRQAMDSGHEQNVRLKNPVPVFISYYTAWVDTQGQLNFRDDIYGHDSSLVVKMFSGNK
ncbi:MAG: L,D-transpeptidase family protein [Chitinophagaceae bacterium]|nr:L,D-transpeptidase family protein [Chitinophagaceae bacterium]